eukprot:10984463-Heterocapsa_arctica.AAC.1
MKLFAKHNRHELVESKVLQAPLQGVPVPVHLVVVDVKLVLRAVAHGVRDEHAVWGAAVPVCRVHELVVVAGIA